jgi:hypothetical protein
MRRRINRTLLTATAASAAVITLSFMATGAVGAATTTAGLASSVTPIPPTDTTCTPIPTAPVPDVNCAVAGYQASNRLFRFASASIVVPHHTGETPVEAVALATTPATEADAALYVALDDSSDTAFDYARVGIMPCTQVHSSATCPLTTDTPAGSGWVLFSSVLEVDNGTGVPVTTVVALPPSVEGHGVSVSVYLSPTGNSVHTTITMPTTTAGVTIFPGHTYNHTFAVSGPIYTTAQAVADWTGPTAVAQTEPYMPTALLAPTSAYSQFEAGRFTTWNGTKGTFDGKWITRQFVATTDGTTNTAVATSPGYLWNNDTGFKNDAFGIWIRHL